MTTIMVGNDVCPYGIVFPPIIFLFLEIYKIINYDFCSVNVCISDFLWR